MHKDEYFKIAELEHSHWWYRSLHNMVLFHIQKHFEGREINIIDAGCGTGGLISFLNSYGYQNVEGFDISDVALTICHEKNIPAFKGNLENISSYYEDNRASVIISNDTFYFLDLNAQRILADDINRVLCENGLLIANMPSLKAFKGIHDLRVGIKKRFEMNNLWKIFDRNKYTLVSKIYWPFILSPFIWISRFLQRLKLKMNPGSAIQSDLRSPGRFVDWLLFPVTDSENRLLRFKPFGSSIFLVMKKTTLNSKKLG